MADQSIGRMIGFIQNEAKEKATEIEMEANEAYTIEKQRIFEAEKKKIKQDYERKQKSVESERRIAESNLRKAARLRVLKSREQFLEEILDDVKKRLAAHTKDASYRNTIITLGAQAAACIQLPDGTPFKVRSTQADKPVVEGVLNEIGAAYKQLTQRSGKFTFDPKNVLGAEELGGVMVTNEDGLIRASNTLHAREAKVVEMLSPEIRLTLFGEPPKEIVRTKEEPKKH